MILSSAFLCERLFEIVTIFVVHVYIIGSCLSEMFILKLEIINQIFYRPTAKILCLLIVFLIDQYLYNNHGFIAANYEFDNTVFFSDDL